MRAEPLKAENGIAMIVALLVLVVIGIFAATVATSSVSLSKSANNDRNSKKAFAAAEAGMRRMLYMLNKQGETICAVATLPAGKFDCAPLTGTLGNGVTYETSISPVLDNAVSGLGQDTCIGQEIPSIILQAGTETRTVPVLQRCITSIGTAHGKVRRTQARVAAAFATQLFKVGLTGRERTCVAAGGDPGCPAISGNGGGNTQIFSDIGSNILIRTANNVETCGNMLTAPGGSSSGGPCNRIFPGAIFPPALPTNSTYTCPNGTPPSGPPCQPGQIEANPQSPPDVTSFFTSYLAARCLNIVGTCTLLPSGATSDGDTSTLNDNTALASAVTACGGSYDSSTRIVDLDPPGAGRCSGDLLLPPGVFNVCGIVDFGNNMNFGSSATDPLNPTVVLLDSSARTGSLCSSIENFTMGNNSTVRSADPLAFEIFAYGNPNCAGWVSDTQCTNSGQRPHQILINNSGSSSGRLGAGVFAPNSELMVANSGNSTNEMVGAFYARWLDIGNGFQFREDPRYTTQIFPPKIKLYSRSAWRECLPTAPSSYRSGC